MSCKPQYKGVRYNSLEELYKANGVNPQQKLQAQQAYSNYLNTGKKDIQGFKEFLGGKKLENKEKASKLPVVKTVPTVPQNNVNMDNIPSTSIPKKGRGRTLSSKTVANANQATEANRIEIELETKKIKDNTEKPCNKKPKK